MFEQRSNINMAEALRFWRAKKGYSQLKLAKLAQTSALTISQLESGKRKGRGATLERILNGLKISREEFFAMREGAAGSEPARISEPFTGTVPEGMPTVVQRESATVRLSNLDLELLNRVLNLDFESKLETLRFLQNLK